MAKFNVNGSIVDASNKFDAVRKFKDAKTTDGDFLEQVNRENERYLAKWGKKEADIWRKTDWKARGYKPLLVTSNTFSKDVKVVGSDEVLKNVKFILEISPNPIFEPKYVPEGEYTKYRNYCWVAGHGTKKNGYIVVDWAETWEHYNKYGMGAFHDSKESDLKVFEALDKTLEEFKKLDNKYAKLAEMENKYWSSWDGYRGALKSGKITQEKLDALEKQFVVANNEFKKVAEKWNTLCDLTIRKENWIANTGAAVNLKLNLDMPFPETHYYGKNAYENMKYRLDKVKERVLKEGGTGSKNWSKDSVDDATNEQANAVYVLNEMMKKQVETVIMIDNFRKKYSLDDAVYKTMLKNINDVQNNINFIIRNIDKVVKQ